MVSRRIVVLLICFAPALACVVYLLTGSRRSFRQKMDPPNIDKELESIARTLLNNIYNEEPLDGDLAFDRYLTMQFELRDDNKAVPAIRLAAELGLINSRLANLILETNNSYLLLQLLVHSKDLPPIEGLDPSEFIRKARVEDALKYYDYLGITYGAETFELERQFALYNFKPSLINENITSLVSRYWTGPLLWTVERKLFTIFDAGHVTEFLDTHPAEAHIVFRLLCTQESADSFICLAAAPFLGSDIGSLWTASILISAIRTESSRKDVLKRFGKDEGELFDRDFLHYQKMYKQYQKPIWYLDNLEYLLY